MSLDRRIHEAVSRIEQAVAKHVPATFASSFGAEDMVVLDLIARHALLIEVFTLDTGRLPEETQALIARAREVYGVQVRVLFPDAQAVETYVATHGNNAFYESVELRKRCCEIRKLEPLRRALAAKALWITGLRREQSVTRADVEVLAFDAANGLMKLNPLADWSDTDVWAYIERHDVPVNALHSRGYPSIGCAPCTRAVQPGEDPRAGRWWWEQPTSRECGLHVDSQGRLVRTKATV
ncbi:MAG TPA: phosphoadenylyl-sulfate reductase [Burkholderiales bacterium]|nr:phosphoadenylyl-sulfate reductase [Burkholderiales bacterium]